MIKQRKITLYVVVCDRCLAKLAPAQRRESEARAIADVLKGAADTLLCDTCRAHVPMPHGRPYFTRGNVSRRQ